MMEDSRCAPLLRKYCCPGSVVRGPFLVLLTAPSLCSAGAGASKVRISGIESGWKQSERRRRIRIGRNSRCFTTFTLRTSSKRAASPREPRTVYASSNTCLFTTTRKPGLPLPTSTRRPVRHHFVNQVGGNELWKNLESGKFRNIPRRLESSHDRVSVAPRSPT